MAKKEKYYKYGIFVRYEGEDYFVISSKFKEYSEAIVMKKYLIETHGAKNVNMKKL